MWSNKKEPESYGSKSAELFELPTNFVSQPDNLSPRLIKKDPTEVMSEARIRVIYGQDEPLIIKYLVKELDITSAEAQAKIADIKAKLNTDFLHYISSCTQDNILILKTMLTKALEKNDTRNAVEIMRNLDQLTQRYMEDNGLIEHKVREEEIQISFS